MIYLACYAVVAIVVIAVQLINAPLYDENENPIGGDDVI